MSEAYDPRANGAKCDECPLNGNKVVPPSGNKNASVFLIGEGPGRREVEYGEAFVGQSGELLNEMLNEAGLPR